MKRATILLAGGLGLVPMASTSALAQQGMTMPGMVAGSPVSTALVPANGDGVGQFDGMMPAMDNRIDAHGLLEQFEGRIAGRTTDTVRYDGQFWLGTDDNKLWIRSEGDIGRGGTLTDGQHDILYDRPVSTYFDLQAGLRVDADDNPARTWAAIGVQGLSLYFFELEATAYLRDRGHAAARLQASYDILLTNRFILQPQAELNLYTRSDDARGVGSGLSDVDAGLRLRYEGWRKLAPYVGLTWDGTAGQASSRHVVSGQQSQDLRLAIGLRTWF